MKGIFGLGIALLFFVSCTRQDQHTASTHPNFEGLDFCRVDQFVFNEKPFAENESRCDSVFSFFCKEILRIGGPDSWEFGSLYREFSSDANWKHVQTEIEEVHGNLELEKARIEQFFGKYAGVFSQEALPTVFFYNGGFNFGVFPDKALLGVGLEWYLGKKSSVYPRLAPESFPNYRKAQMVPERLVAQACLGYLNYHHFESKGNRWVDLAIAHGKMMYLASLFLEEEPLHYWLGYSQEKWNWAVQKEYFVWKDIVKNEVLYSTDLENRRRFFVDGPFTNGYPQESPANLGKYMGYRMVVDFMRDHEEVSLNELLTTKSDLILKSYNPKK